MNNLNSILLEGNLTTDPELKDLKTTKLCTFSVATNWYYKQDDKYVQEVSYFNVTCWGKLAGICKEYLKKGRGVRVIGRIKQERWEEGSDEPGSTTVIKKSKVVIMAENVEFKPVFKENK